MSAQHSEHSEPGAHGAGPPGPQLVIDGASDEVTAAVVDVAGDGAVRVLAERRWTVDGTVAAALLAGVSAVLEEAGTPPDALVAVVVDAGPGRYGGLRASVAAAQGIALARELPLAPVHRLEAVALPYLAPGGDGPAAEAVVAVHQIGRGRIGWAAYASAPAPRAAPVVLSAPRIDTVADAVAAAPRGAVWCGEIEADLLDALAARPGGDTTARPVPRAERAAARRAEDLVTLALGHSTYTRPDLVDAIYLRRPSITPPRDPGQPGTTTATDR